MSERATAAQYRALISERIDIIYQRLEALEQTIATGQKEAEEAAGETGEREFAVRPISVLYGMRRAFYGYAMLLESMGLSKDQKQTIQQLQNVMNMVIRLQQTIQMVDIAMKAFYANAGPVGWMMLALSAGTLAGSMVYGSRGLGG